MPQMGSADINRLRALQAKMNKLVEQDYDKFCEDMAIELAARMLAKVVKRTPVGQYPAGSGKTGGTLRRGWNVNKNNLSATKTGNAYEITLINPVEYASYVEFGHRTRGGAGFVTGQFFTTISEKEIEREAPAIIERKLKALLGEVF